jgi:hypothetical protein
MMAQIRKYMKMPKIPIYTDVTTPRSTTRCKMGLYFTQPLNKVNILCLN